MKDINSMEEFNARIKRVIITKEQIAEAIEKAGKEIDKLYDGRPILLVSILKGAFVFMADMCRAVSVPCEVGFMCAKSYYEGTVSTGVVNISMDLEHDLTKYHVVIVEDIIDTGRTLALLKEKLLERGPKSLKICTAFDKPSRRVNDLKPDYNGITIPDEFIVGYGLDLDGKYRDFDDVRIVRKE